MDDYKRFSYYDNNGLTGLVNLGNTCYMNSIIQCLSNTLELTHYFLGKQFQKDLSSDNYKNIEFQLVIQYIHLLSVMWEKNGLVSPKTFKKALGAFVKKFLGGRQHDSHECLTFILDTMHSALSKKLDIKNIAEPKRLEHKAIDSWISQFKDSYSFMERLFYGQLYTEIICPVCENTSDVFDSYNCLTISVPEAYCELQECLEQKKEILDDNNMWYCEKCENKVNGIKQTKVWSFPRILIVCLKKFKKGNKKIDSIVNFDINNIELKDYSGKTKKYELYAVSNHSGGTQGGHYWSICKKKTDWFIFNDTQVHQIKESEVLSKENYILFFRCN